MICLSLADHLRFVVLHNYSFNGYFTCSQYLFVLTFTVLISILSPCAFRTFSLLITGYFMLNCVVTCY